MCTRGTPILSSGRDRRHSLRMCNERPKSQGPTLGRHYIFRGLGRLFKHTRRSLYDRDRLRPQGTQSFVKKRKVRKLDYPKGPKGPYYLYVQTVTKLKKRSQVKTNKELSALKALRENQDIADAIAFYLSQPHLSAVQIYRLRAALAVLSHAPLNKKLLASL